MRREPASGPLYEIEENRCDRHVDEIDEHRTHHRNHQERQGGIAVLPANSVHVGHRIRRCAKTEAAETADEQSRISFNTARPVFTDGPAAGSFRLRGGSFGRFEPSGRIDFRLSDKLSVSAVAAGIFSRGDFPYGDGQVRTNNDMILGRGGVDVMGLTDGGDWHAKAYVNVSHRGTPGSVDFPSSDRFMMGVVGLSLPEATLLNKVMTWKLIGIFFGTVTLFIILSGWVFNAVL